jgi:protein-S-isoprenylcysteine O-methyltransferase Ste14
VALVTELIAICWVIWILTWIATAIAFRPATADAPPRGPLRHRSFRLIVAIGILFAVSTRHAGAPSFGDGVRTVGVVLCAAGVAVAIWARLCLGRNWGMPMSVRAKPTLVRRGPYRVVRHPIYSGLLLMILGSALASGPAWLIAAAAAAAYFVMSLRVEEADMAAFFPEDYPRYAAHTKRLIPFVY